MKIRIPDQMQNSSWQSNTEFQLDAKPTNQTTEINPSPPIRIIGVNTFGLSYKKDEELRVFVKIRD